MSFVLPPAPGTVGEGWLDGYVHHFSASGLRLLRICPEAWRQRYILGRKERPGESLVLGSAVHDALGYTHTQKIDTHEDLPVPEVVEYFHDQSWPTTVADDGGEEEIKWEKKPDDVRRDGERMLHAYHTVVSPRIQPLAIERKVDFVVPGIPVPFIGYLDVVEEGDTIDLKTGKQVTRKPDANWRLQGLLYAVATGKPTHFHSVSRAQTPSIATPKESEEMSVAPLPHWRELVERVLRDFAGQVEFYFERYGPDQTWPLNGLVHDYKGGPACNYCGFRRFCPAWQHEQL
jgi:hypothetical protein